MTKHNNEHNEWDETMGFDRSTERQGRISTPLCSMTIRFRTFGRTSTTTTDMASSCQGLIIQYIQLTRHFDKDDLFSLSLGSLHHIHNNRLFFVVLRLEMQHQWVDTRWRYIEDYTQDLTSPGLVDHLVIVPACSLSLHCFWQQQFLDSWSLNLRFYHIVSSWESLKRSA